MKVLAVDPGLTTGWVIFEPQHRLQIRVIEWGETRGPLTFEAMVRKRVDRLELDHCVCENWVPYRDRKRTWEPDALHVIGMMRAVFGDENIDLGQLAADAHQWGTDAKIHVYRDGPARVGRGGEGHALMALRHALLWTSKKWNGMI